MGQAAPTMTACHVPTIIDWEQTGSLVSAAKAVDTAHKIEATVTMVRLRDMRCSGVGRAVARLLVAGAIRARARDGKKMTMDKKSARATPQSRTTPPVPVTACEDPIMMTTQSDQDNSIDGEDVTKESARKTWSRKRHISHERLTELLAFDPMTGAFTWKVASSNRVKIGSRAGTFHRASGSRKICIDRENFAAHLLAFFYVNKRWPNTEVRAIDYDYDNCAISNLQEVTRIELAHERGKNKNNKSGYRGVSLTKRDTWQAAVTCCGKQMSLGAHFDTPEAASEVYEEARRRLSGVTVEAEAQRILEGLRIWKGQKTAWRFLMRDHDQHGWSSFEEISREVVDVPEMRYAMVALDPTRPIGPGNFRFAFPREATRQTSEGIVEHNRVRREANRDQMRHKYLITTYNITLADERELLNRQLGVCAICGKGEEKTRGHSKRSLSIDHNHQTNVVRGLLCGSCNEGLGYFCDDPRLLERAIDYLHGYDGDNPVWSHPSVTEITHLPVVQHLLRETGAQVIG
jgi:hypothetical protein